MMQNNKRSLAIWVLGVLAVGYVGVLVMLVTGDDTTQLAYRPGTGGGSSIYSGPQASMQHGSGGSSSYAMHGVTSPMHSVGVSTHRSSGAMRTSRVSSGGADARLWTSSSQRLQSYGGGAGGGTGSSYSRSAKKQSTSVSYASASIPMTGGSFLASNSTSSSARSAAALQTASAYAAGGPRRAKPGYDGYNGQTVTDGGETWIWSEDAEDWVNSTPEGATKIEGGETYVYQGGAWVKINNQADPSAPIGDAPWLLMVLLAVGYACWRKRRVPETAL